MPSARLAVLLLMAMLLPLVAVAVDHNACDYKCSLGRLDKCAKRTACLANAAPFIQYLNAVDAYCSNYDKRMQGRGTVDAAIELLVRTGRFKLDELRRLEIRFCNMLEAGGYTWADGMTLDNKKILLASKLIDAAPIRVAKVLAHEVYHIRQYQNWGRNGFASRYFSELTKGHGTGYKNKVEREAYDFGNEIASILDKLR